MPSYMKNSGGVEIPMNDEERANEDAKNQAWIDSAFDREIKDLRTERNRLLAETDFYALQDVNMSEDITNYRQALRDLTNGLSTVEEVYAITRVENHGGYPTKP